MTEGVQCWDPPGRPINMFLDDTPFYGDYSGVETVSCVRSPTADVYCSLFVMPTVKWEQRSGTCTRAVSILAGYPIHDWMIA